jgi:hypothetical protein
MSYSKVITISIGGISACTSLGVSWTNSINSDKIVYVGDSTSNAYTFTPPTLTTTSSICVIGTHSVTVLTKSPSSLSYGI